MSGWNPKLLTREAVMEALHRDCAMRIYLGKRIPNTTQAERSFYVAKLSSGLVKIGISSNLGTRFRSLRYEAHVRFGDDFSSDVISMVAVVPGGEGRPLEIGIIRELRSESVRCGEWFRGPLSNAVVAALEAA
jgi:hypothetical protein